MKKLVLALSVGGLSFGIVGFGFGADKPSAADSAAFHSFLTARGVHAQWEGDPMALDSAELRTAYPNRRFYFTFKAPPLPPGAAWPDLIEKHKRAMEEYQKHSLRMTVGVDNAEQAMAFQNADDFNVGLMRIKSDADAKVAAAAILSLIGNDQVHPGVISAGEVSVMGTNFGWRCRVQQARGIDGTVVFDPGGKCISANKKLNYVPPVPP